MHHYTTLGKYIIFSSSFLGSTHYFFGDMNLLTIYAIMIFNRDIPKIMFLPYSQIGGNYSGMRKNPWYSIVIIYLFLHDCSFALSLWNCFNQLVLIKEIQVWYYLICSTSSRTTKENLCNFFISFDSMNKNVNRHNFE